MFAIVSLLCILTVSILITRVATVALTLTGLSRESARFQARSAFTGVGFTTTEAEKVVNHPVRRRILMLLMLLGNAGIVTVVSSMMLTVLQTAGDGTWAMHAALLAGGIALLWLAARSRIVDASLTSVITRCLERWSDLEVRDYAGLLHIGRNYRIAELYVEEGDWLCSRSLRDARLRQEGIIVLGVQRDGGEYAGAPRADIVVDQGDTLIIYGSGDAIAALDTRHSGVGGELAHGEAVLRHRQALDEENREADAQAA